MKFREILRIIFCILSVLSFLFTIAIGIWKGLLYALISLAVTVLFAMLMLAMRSDRKAPPSDGPDFFHPEGPSEPSDRDGENKSE